MPFDWQGFLPEHTIAISAPGLEGVTEVLEQSNVAFEFVAPQSEVSPVGAEFTSDSLQSLESKFVHNCTRCSLHKTRLNTVFGEGNPNAKLVFVGEAPGESEDELGRPFVGQAGELLTRMIEAMGLSRESVYILNIVKCRPPGNRNPEPIEVESCAPYLQEQLRHLQPQVIVALGAFAAHSLLKTQVSISELRGKLKPLQLSVQFKNGHTVQVMPTFHPAYLLRQPSAKKEVWLDLQGVAKVLGIEIPKR